MQDEDSVALLHEKHEEETPEKDKWTHPSDSESPESGITHSSEGGAECEERGSNGDEDSSLWSEDEDLTGNKKKWESMKTEKGDRDKPEIKEAKCGR